MAGKKLVAIISDAASTGTVKVLNFGTPKMFAIITLKFKQRCLSIEKYVQKVQMEWQTV